MNISSMVLCDKNWELENGKVCFNSIRLTNAVGHVARGSRLPCYIEVQVYLYIQDLT